MHRALSASIGAIVVISACETQPLPTSGRGVGGVSGAEEISALWDTTVQSSPEVEAGYQFTVSFKTVVGLCLVPDYVAEQGGGASIALTPFDRNAATDSTACPQYLTSTVRSTQVVFTAIGLDTITVHGSSGFGASSEPIVIQRIVRVIPPPNP